MLMWAPKGGAGVSVTAAALATVLARQGGCRLVDLVGDQPAVLGLSRAPDVGVADWLRAHDDAGADGLHRLAVEAGPGLALVGRGGGALPAGSGDRLTRALGPPSVPTVIDAGTLHDAGGAELVAALAAASSTVLVTRPCFLALRRAVEHPLLPTVAGVVLVSEPGRALRAVDVERVLDRPVVGTIRAEARVARAVDAGVLAARLPDNLERGARRILAAVSVHGRDSSPPAA